PTFLYDDAQLYQPDAIDEGLLRGYYLLRVFQHIFTGPGSAWAGKQRESNHRASNSKIHGMDCCDPNTIAYAASLARFSISGLDTWGWHDGLFDAKKFYYGIIMSFDEDDVWAEETLEWWDS
ncbi:hypothetical protein BD779DRAFT_1441139, partial [Infundibulicybe gibba]